MKRKEIKGRGILRKMMEDRYERMRLELTRIEAESAAREQRAIREAVAEAKEFRGHLEEAGISYITLLHLVALQQDISGLAHNMLLGYERGEGWPNGI